MKHASHRHRKFRHAAAVMRRHLPPWLPAGLFLTDPRRVPDPGAVIATLPDEVGVIIRHFGRPELIQEAGELVTHCHRSGRTVLIAADPELATALKADGVHWPARMASAAAHAARWFDLNTMSVHTVHDLRRAAGLGMDAALLSAVFPSDSPSAGQPAGLMRLAATTRSAGLPLYALGGITIENVARIAPFAGAAAVSGWIEAGD